MRKPYRCINCPAPKGQKAFEFISTDGVCPQCGLSEEKNPRHVGQLVMVHFDPPSGILGEGKRYRACNPNVGITHTSAHLAAAGLHAGSGMPGVVTCPACRDTEVFKAELAKCHDKGWMPYEKLPELPQPQSQPLPASVAVPASNMLPTRAAEPTKPVETKKLEVKTEPKP